jgi:hypothetical protein
MDWHFRGGQDLKRDELALGCSIQGIGEEVKASYFWVRNGLRKETSVGPDRRNKIGTLTINWATRFDQC